MGWNARRESPHRFPAGAQRSPRFTAAGADHGAAPAGIQAPAGDRDRARVLAFSSQLSAVRLANTRLAAAGRS